MSAFIVNDKTLSRIISFMSSWDFRHIPELKNKFWNKFGREELSKSEVRNFNKLTYDEQQDLILTKIGQVFREINNEAVNQRYNLKDKPQTFIFSFEKCDVFQAYNHIRCLTYQMSEGDVPTTETYKYLEEVEKVMAFEIANQHPKVKSAEWEAEN